MFFRLMFILLFALPLISCSGKKRQRYAVKPEMTVKWADLLSKARPVITKDPAAEEVREDLKSWLKSRDDKQAQKRQRILKQPKVTGAFVELTIRDALFEISTQTKIPIVVDPTVQGSVMLQLNDVPFETALRLVCFAGGYSYATDGSAYFVGTPNPNSASYGLLTETRLVKTYRKAADIAKRLNESMKPFISFNENDKQIVLTGPSAIIDRLESDIRQLDAPPEQIEIEVLVVEKKWGDDFNIGIQYDQFQAALTRTYRIGSGDLPDANQLEIIGQMSVLFNFLAEKDMAKIHAHPKIITTDGTPAEIRSETEAYVLITRPGVNLLQTELEVIKAGTNLKVTPNLTRNGEIELTLEPEISDAVGTSSQSIGGLPLVTRRASKNTVRIKHGEVLIIGGLYQETVRELKSGVPILKDMPVLETIFGRVEKQEGSSELLIFVSPRIVR